jgi:hypothetical protein
MRLISKAIPCAAAIMLVAAGPAAAALTSAQAAQSGAQAAKAVAKQTHASSFRVTRCARVSGAKTICHAEAHYVIGARRCTFDITVTQPSNSQRPRTTPSNFLCY